MPARVHPLAADLRRLFGARLQSVVAYGDMEDDNEEVHTLALVEQLTFQDLAACAPLAAGWRRAGLAVPLLLSRSEFARTLDVFPIEYGEIIARHAVVLGDDPFAGLSVNPSDLRRACELQVKSHLIHLRGGYVESGGEPAAVGRLLSASAASLRAVVANVERLDPGAVARAGITPALIQEIASAGSSTIAEPSALLGRYVAALEQLWQQVDAWGRP
jgi:hypothetical protein